MKTDEIVIEHLLRGGRGLLNVEYIATQQQGVGLMLHAPTRKLLKEMLMFVSTIIILIDDLPKMEVGSMEYLHRESGYGI